MARCTVSSWARFPFHRFAPLGHCTWRFSSSDIAEELSADWCRWALYFVVSCLCFIIDSCVFAVFRDTCRAGRAVCFETRVFLNLCFTVAATTQKPVGEGGLHLMRSIAKLSFFSYPVVPPPSSSPVVPTVGKRGGRPLMSSRLGVLPMVAAVENHYGHCIVNGCQKESPRGD